MYQAFGKRAFDLVSSAAALVALSPVLVVVAIAIRLEDGGAALFRQVRVGKDGDPFTLFKFRSMPVGSANVPSASAARLTVTRIGGFIRRTNIDELPQLLNILNGDMSVVGPRPALPSQTGLLELRRKSGAFAVQPGLTGLAQVRSYDGMPEAEKAALDGRYASRITLLGDVTIIFRTVGYLFRRPPVY